MDRAIVLTAQIGLDAPLARAFGLLPHHAWRTAYDILKPMHLSKAWSQAPALAASSSADLRSGAASLPAARGRPPAHHRPDRSEGRPSPGARPDGQGSARHGIHQARATETGTDHAKPDLDSQERSGPDAGERVNAAPDGRKGSGL